MHVMTHRITSGIKAGLHVRIVKDGSWVLVADVDGIEHKVRRKQLAELTGETGTGLGDEPLYVVDPISSGSTESHGDPSSWTPDIDHDPIDDADVVRELVECEELVEDSDQNPKSMSGAFQSRRAKYKETDGCGDELQLFLKGFAPSDVIAIAEHLLGLSSGELSKRYEHLNNGQKRMNAGNRIRSLVKKEEKTIDDVRRSAEAVCFGEDNIS
ncbi:TPA: hypothetical protein NJ755_003751 [Vibrio parahaemolyticus]|nr:hypothetical protein BBM78_09530 [Vibrio parahaemolyticus]HCG9599646.1 hypothetical protein [Vibrio parahaemolyticus]HCH0108893.1 hypothetical protein [Vibrio parahaemolyticus]HCH0124070.1 hypothetical protein [Vibrio parahaemolyticus]HCH0227752.1 hypothetical protein [Vibrio parahaemolyticus]